MNPPADDPSGKLVLDMTCPRCGSQDIEPRTARGEKAMGWDCSACEHRFIVPRFVDAVSGPSDG